MASPICWRGAAAPAEKMARTLWAMMVSGEVYRQPQQA
jgi:hypothetical protein